MFRRTVVSERKVKAAAALKGLSAKQLNNVAGFGPNYIYRLWGRDSVTLKTLNAMAEVLDCSACDLLEDQESTQDHS